MSENRITLALSKHVQDNFWLYIISLFCICTGIVIGIYSVKYMGSFERSDLVSYLNNFSSTLKDGSINYQLIFIQTLKNNLPLILILWFLGLTMIGLPAILLLDLFKGFTLGFTMSFIISQLGTKGMWLSLIGIFPQNLIYIPAVVISSVIAMEFSITILKDRSEKKWTSNIWVRITSYSFMFILISSFMFLGFFMESYLSPNIVKLLMSNIGAWHKYYFVGDVAYV